MAKREKPTSSRYSEINRTLPEVTKETLSFSFPSHLHTKFFSRYFLFLLPRWQTIKLLRYENPLLEVPNWRAYGTKEKIAVVNPIVKHLEYTPY